MSDFATHSPIQTGDLLARLRHLGFSLLPLGVFVAGALSYDRLAAFRGTSTDQGVVTAAAGPSAAGQRQAADARAVLSAEKQAKAASSEVTATRAMPPPDKEISELLPSKSQPAKALPSLRDERSLLDLIGLEASGIAGAPHRAEGQVRERKDAVVLGSAKLHPLRIEVGAAADAGAYAIVRGVPRSAGLTHGIPVGEASWLIDGADIGSAAIDIAAGTPGLVSMEVMVLSGASRVVSKERLVLELKPAPDVAPVAPVAAAPAPVPAPVPASVPALATATERVAEVIEKSTAAAATLTLRVARDIELRAGRGNLLRFDLGSPDAVPPGSYVVMRGFPNDTALSRGIPIGGDAWLLAVDDLADLEVRLPVKMTGEIALDVRLLSSEGALIAQDQHVLLATSQSDNRLEQPAEPAVIFEPARANEVPAVVPSKPAEFATAAIPLPALPTPTPTPTPTLAPEAVVPRAENVSLQRGRRMLGMGNIAVARPLLERAAAEGSGEGAALLAASFDPVWLKKSGALGLAGDPARASHWYGEARRLGIGDVDRIVALPPARR